MGTQKNRLNKTVRLSTRIICYNWWVRKYLQFYAQNFCLNLCPFMQPAVAQVTAVKTGNQRAASSKVTLFNPGWQEIVPTWLKNCCLGGKASTQTNSYNVHLETILSGSTLINSFLNKKLTLCIWETPKWVLLQIVKTQMKCRTMRHFIRVYTVC